MFFNARKFTLAALAVFCIAASASADVKIKSRSSFGGPGAQGSESTVYIKGKRQRTESGEQTASIMQCDLRRTVQMNNTTKTYVVSPFDGGGARAQTAVAEGGAVEPARKGGVVTSTITTTDTGERKQMFGYTARRIKTSMVTESSPDACNRQKSRVETDGWYIDLKVEFDCYERAAAAGYYERQQGGCRDEHRTKQVGAGRTGYPVYVTTTFYDESGKATTTMTQEVLEISNATLDAALFDVPADYREVGSVQEMYTVSVPAQAGDDTQAAAGANGLKDSPVAGSLPLDAKAADATALGPKQPGVVRVGVVMPRATAAEGLDSNVLAEAVRNTLIKSLSGTSLEVVSLESFHPDQVNSESRQKECDYVVQTTVVHKKGGGGGGFGGFLKKASPVTDHVLPAVGTGSTAGNVAANVAVTAAYTAADFSSAVKNKDELTLEYKLQREVGSAPAAAGTFKSKARANGEDLISQVVRQAATDILAGATGK